MTRVLVIKPSSLGDVIHALPAVRLLRQRLGASLERLTWVVNDSFRPLLELAPDVDRIVSFPRREIWHRGVVRRFVSVLQEEPYDVAIDFQGLLRSGLMAHFSHAPRRVGFANGRELSPWFYTERVPVPRRMHAVERNLELVAAAFPASGPSGSGRAWDYPAGALLDMPSARREAARALLDEPAPGTPVLAVGHSSRWHSKNWSVGFFGAVLDEIAARRPETRIWLLGAPDERERGERVRAACRVARPLNLSGASDMPGLAALLSESGALLTNDSGPMHLAAALAVPVVALFGATDPELTGPYGEPGLHRVFRSVCPKSPCFRHDCPFGEERCPQGTSAAEVADAVLARLARRGG